MRATNIWEVGFNFNNQAATTETLVIAADTMQDALNNAPKLQVSPPSRYTSVKLIATNVYVDTPIDSGDCHNDANFKLGFSECYAPVMDMLTDAMENHEGCTTLDVIRNIVKQVRNLKS